METIRFDELNLDPRILRAVTDMGFEAASPIQAQAIPVEMEGHDMIGQAQTGTGKTAAFGIPLLMKMDPENRKTQAMILCPTRELAIQVAEELRRLAKYMSGIKILPVYGGQEIVKQIRSLKGGVQIIVGTPGRVMDHMRRKTIRTDAIHTVVLDEADEMLNMGFLEDMETILGELPEERQTVMFSATMPHAIAQIAQKFQKDPKMVQVVKKELTVPKVTQYYYEVKPRNKVEVMCRLLDLYSPKLSVAFCNTKKQVDELVQALQGRGYFAEGLHGDLKQEQRDRVMGSFRNGATEILVATDVAARGIDVDDVEAVFNYDIPQDDEYYVHRIGRTGRAGKKGVAITFIEPREYRQLKLIERLAKTKLVRKQLPSSADILERQREIIKTRLLKTLENNNFADYHTIVSDLTVDYDLIDVAAAALKLSVEGFKEKEEEPISKIENTGGAPGMVRLFMNIGRSQKIRPEDIVRAFASEADIPGNIIGVINIYDRFTFVEVPEDVAERVLSVMHKNTVKGYKINVEPAKSR